MNKIEYATIDERETIIASQRGMGNTLLKEENVTKGNFLYFVGPTKEDLMGMELAKLKLEIIQLKGGM